jgi:hypothetical protein
MKRFIFLVVIAASPALAQEEGRIPSEAACNAVRDRVQIALAQADRALQADNHADAERWSAIGANYATIHAAFCQDADRE